MLKIFFCYFLELFGLNGAYLLKHPFISKYGNNLAFTDQSYLEYAYLENTKDSKSYPSDISQGHSWIK